MLESSKIRLKEALIATLLIILGALLLLLPAIWNGFPHVYSDSGAYLATAFEGTVPMSRPTGYGMFIRYTAFGNNLWFTIFAQALLFSGLTWRAIQVVLPASKAWKIFPIVMLFAAVGTGANWYAGQLMPDIFTGLLMLVFYLLVFDKALNFIGKLSLAFLAYVFCFSHYSHMALLMALSFLFLIWYVWQRIRKRPSAFRLQALIWTTIPALLAIFSFYYVNYSNDFGWRMTRSSHIFTMAKLSESGMLKVYLDETCAEKHWSLCPYADSLPDNAAAFIWNDDSPFKKTGYWDGSRPQYDSLLSDFFSRRKYLTWYAKDGVKSTVKQCFALAVGEGLTPYNEVTSPFKFFERAMPEKVPDYYASVQFDRLVSFEVEDKILKGLMALSFLSLLGGLIWLAIGKKWKRIAPEVLGFVLLSILVYVVNAAITGALANVYSRLQARVAWLIPFAAILLVWAIWNVVKGKPKA